MQGPDDDLVIEQGGDPSWLEDVDIENLDQVLPELGGDFRDIQVKLVTHADTAQCCEG